MTRETPATTVKDADSRFALVAVRRLVLGVLWLTMLGTCTELLLVGHTEDALQWVPLLLMAGAMVVLVWHAVAGSPASIRVLRASMMLFVLGGVVGLVLHGQSKLEFKRETDPSLAGMELFFEAMKSQSPPALAPGVLIQLGLLGLVYTYRHPAMHSQNE